MPCLEYVQIDKYSLYGLAINPQPVAALNAQNLLHHFEIARIRIRFPITVTLFFFHFHKIVCFSMVFLDRHDSQTRVVATYFYFSF